MANEKCCAKKNYSEASNVFVLETRQCQKKRSGTTWLLVRDFSKNSEIFTISEIADDFASDYLKNADNMSENELKRLREDLRKKIGKCKKSRKNSDDEERRDRKKSRTSSEDERKRSRPSRTVTISKSSRKSSRERSSPSVVFNPVTKQYEKNIRRGESNAMSDGDSDEGEIKGDEKITADDLINELINDETNETDLKLVTDVIMESSKNRKSTTKNGDSHRHVQKSEKFNKLIIFAGN